MKLLFPVAVIVLASGACCCCGDDLPSLFEEIERELDGAGGGGGGGSGARAFASLPAGERVRIADLNSEDAYYSDKSSIVGKECTLDTESSYNGDGWHGGAVKCTDGSTYYFYKAAYEDLGR